MGITKVVTDVLQTAEAIHSNDEISIRKMFDYLKQQNLLANFSTIIKVDAGI